ncbi:tyrosine-protein phosphatase [Mycobacterium sp. SMC-8]|nr:tyrosine-protein phosphatase [Mycobacterium sp. SMC-8]
MDHAARSLSTLANLRDLGGLATTNGGRTRSGVLYRSALPIVDDELPTTVPVWPVRTVIDLRSPKEQTATAHPLLVDDTELHRVPLLTDEDVARQHGYTSLDAVYSGILANAGDRLARVLQIAATAPAPVLLHCAAGKDRTGVASAMLLHAAGVDAAHIVADYTATEQHMDAVLARIQLADPDFVRGPNLYDNDLVRAAPETIGRVLEHWDRYPGGICNWLVDQGAEAAVIAQWQRRLVDSS